MTCEIPLFPPGICTFPKAPPTEVCFVARQRSPEVSREKWKWGSGELEMKRLWETVLLWNWKVGNGNGNRKMRNGNGQMGLENNKKIGKWGMGLVNE